MTTPSATTMSAMPDRFVIEEGGTPVLLGTHCEACGTSFLGTLEFCRRCTSERLVPYALAQVALPDGVLVASRVVDWEEGGELSVGERVDVAAVSVTSGDGEDVAVYGWQRGGSPA